MLFHPTCRQYWAPLCQTQRWKLVGFTAGARLQSPLFTGGAPSPLASPGSCCASVTGSQKGRVKQLSCCREHTAQYIWSVATVIQTSNNNALSTRMTYQTLWLQGGFWEHTQIPFPAVTPWQPVSSLHHTPLPRGSCATRHFPEGCENRGRVASTKPCPRWAGGLPHTPAGV